MRLGPERVGPRGLTLLGVTGVVGVVLAVHGYGNGNLLGAPNPAGTTGPSTSAPSTSAPSTSASSTPSTTETGGQAGPTTTSPSGGSNANQKVGPLLSSTQYANYAFQVYPGPESSRAKTATAGFSIKVTPGSGTFSVSVSAAGTTRAPQTTSYPTGDKVYFVETTLGDDSNDADYNYGDDGIVVTDATGRIVQ